MSGGLPLEQAHLVALQPAPSALASDAPPPWPPPALRVQPEPPGAYTGMSGAVQFGLFAMGLGVLAFKHHQEIGVMMGVCGVVAWIHAARSSGAGRAERRRQRQAHEEHVGRARLTWARVEHAAIVDSVRGKGGVVTAYVVELNVVPWHPADEGGTRQSGPTAQVTLRTKITASTAGHLVPGAYLGVLSDPHAPWVAPQCVLTLSGAQLPL